VLGELERLRLGAAAAVQLLERPGLVGLELLRTDELNREMRVHVQAFAQLNFEFLVFDGHVAEFERTQLVELRVAGGVQPLRLDLLAGDLVELRNLLGVFGVVQHALLLDLECGPLEGGDLGFLGHVILVNFVPFEHLHLLLFLLHALLDLADALDRVLVEGQDLFALLHRLHVLLADELDLVFLLALDFLDFEVLLVLFVESVAVLVFLGVVDQLAVFEDHGVLFGEELVAHEGLGVVVELADAVLQFGVHVAQVEGHVVLRLLEPKDHVAGQLGLAEGFVQLDVLLVRHALVDLAQVVLHLPDLLGVLEQPMVQAHAFHAAPEQPPVFERDHLEVQVQDAFHGLLSHKEFVHELRAEVKVVILVDDLFVFVLVVLGLAIVFLQVLLSFELDVGRAQDVIADHVRGLGLLLAFETVHVPLLVGGCAHVLVLVRAPVKAVGFALVEVPVLALRVAGRPEQRLRGEFREYALLLERVVLLVVLLLLGLLVLHQLNKRVLRVGVVVFEDL